MAAHNTCLSAPRWVTCQRCLYQGWHRPPHQQGQSSDLQVLSGGSSNNHEVLTPTSVAAGWTDVLLSACTAASADSSLVLQPSVTDRSGLWLQELHHRHDELMEEVADLLLSLTDFQEFKSLMLDFKEDQGKNKDLHVSLTPVRTAACRLCNIHAYELGWPSRCLVIAVCAYVGHQFAWRSGPVPSMQGL